MLSVPTASFEDYQTVGRIIELSVAPAFLLVAVASFINVATLRLGRVVDRARFLETAIEQEKGEPRRRHGRELRFLQRRIRAANMAIMSATFAALLVCLVVALLFLSALMRWDAQFFLALLFIGTMALMVIAFSFFLIEILNATESLKVRGDLVDPV